MPKQGVALLISVAFFAWGTQSAAADKVEISADRLEVRHSEGRASFEGHVRAFFGKLRLECASLQVRYDDAGQVSHLAAKGPLSVYKGDMSATAQRAALDVGRGVLVLEGNPRLTSGPHKLSGERVTVHLETGQMEIERATGTFELPLGHRSQE
ncbi:MAG: LptA/OstA family protein [Myxococcota bacterium]|nr:LptA/OstA family protein [Myxococcota bacterium]